MFKPMIAALIAATALVPPALAQDRHGRGGDRGSRSESSGDRGDRGSWRQRSNDSGQQVQGQRGNYRGQAQAQQVQAPQQVQAAPQQQYRGDRGNRGQWNGGQQQQVQAPQPQQQQQYRGNRGDRGQWNGQGQQFRGNRNNGNTGIVPQGQRGDQYRGNDNRRNDGWRGNNGNRGNDWRGNDRNRGDSNWSRNWRGDNRYNWRDRRAHDRNRYRLPRYYAPRGYGYGYNRFSIGITLGSMLFSQQYWIEDPFYYNLPPAYGPYRWVRYYNDALLVDIRTGMVVDVEYDIFW